MEPAKLLQQYLKLSKQLEFLKYILHKIDNDLAFTNQDNAQINAFYPDILSTPYSEFTDEQKILYAHIINSLTVREFQERLQKRFENYQKFDEIELKRYNENLEAFSFIIPQQYWDICYSDFTDSEEEQQEQAHANDKQ